MAYDSAMFTTGKQLLEFARKHFEAGGTFPVEVPIAGLDLVAIDEGMKGTAVVFETPYGRLYLIRAAD